MPKKESEEGIQDQLNAINDSLEEIKFNLVQLLGSAPQQETKAKATFDITPIKELLDSMATEMAQENTLQEILDKIEATSTPKQAPERAISTETLDGIKEMLQTLVSLQDTKKPDISLLSEKLENFPKQETMVSILDELMKFPGSEIITEIREGIKKATGFEEIEKVASTVVTTVDNNVSKINETLQNVDTRLQNIDTRLARLDESGDLTASLPELFERLQNDLKELLEIEREDQFRREEKARIEIERAADLLQTGVHLMDMQPMVEEIKSFVDRSIQEKEALTKSREEILQLLKGLYEEIAKMREDIHELRSVESTLTSVKKFFDAVLKETEAYKDWETKEGT